jgi:hypothetical protein
MGLFLPPFEALYSMLYLLLVEPALLGEPKSLLFINSEVLRSRVLISGIDYSEFFFFFEKLLRYGSCSGV